MELEGFMEYNYPEMKGKMEVVYGDRMYIELGDLIGKYCGAEEIVVPIHVGSQCSQFTNPFVLDLLSSKFTPDYPNKLVYSNTFKLHHKENKLEISTQK